MPTPAPSSLPRLVASAAVALLLATAIAGCGGGSSDGASGSTGDPTTTESAAGTDGATGDPSDTGATTAPASGTGGGDLCAEVTAADVGAILTEADITEAAPSPALTTPTCQYLVDWAGTPLSFIQITWNEDGFLDALRQSNPTATDLAGVEDGVAISEDSIVVAGTSGDFQIDAGVELAEGGAVATQEQLVAIAQLVEQQ